MRLRSRTVVALFVLGLVVGGAATAFASGRVNDPEARPERPLLQATAPAARIAAQVGPAGDLILKRGLASLTHPAVGTYCFLPKPGLAIDVERVVAVATLEYGESSGVANSVQIYARAGDCPTGTIEALTFSDTGSGFEPSDSVAFNLVVP